MASAGRILIMPKGDYNAETEYEMLDLVFHNGKSWVAKKSVVGVEPSDENQDYWFKMCEGQDLTEIIQRIAALEAQMLGAISLDDIDLTPYATKSELTNYATKSELNTINTSLDGRLDVVEPKVTTLTTDMNTVKTNITNLSNSVSGLSSAKFQVVSYKGSGRVGEGTPCSVTVDFAPKVLIYLGYYYNYNNTNWKHQSALSEGYAYTQNVIFCNHLTTEYKGSSGFIEATSNTNLSRFAKKSADGKTIYWYVSGDIASEHHQLNNSVNTYYFLAIG